MLNDEIVSYHDFITEVIKDMGKFMGDGYLLERTQVRKNNGLILDGVIIHKDKEIIMPSIYLNQYYKRYQENGDLDSCVGEVVKVYQKFCLNNQFAVKDIKFEYENLKDKIFYRLVNYEMNSELLKDLPHDHVLDLAIIYYGLMYVDEEGIGSVQFSKEHLKRFAIDKEILRADAIRNTPILFPSIIRPVQSVLMDLMTVNGTDAKEHSKELSDDFNVPMYILSNKQGINGAACLLYHQELQRFYEKINKDFYILPSSIHELILVPVKSDMIATSLDKLVQEVNQTQVLEEEVLSEHAYLYSEICDELEQFYYN